MVVKRLVKPLLAVKFEIPTKPVFGHPDAVVFVQVHHIADVRISMGCFSSHKLIRLNMIIAASIGS